MTDFKGDFHIAIVGAGLAGLATAILLRKAGYKVTVLEQDAELREVRDLRSHQRLLLIKSIQIGAGIQLPANANKVLWAYLTRSSSKLSDLKPLNYTLTRAPPFYPFLILIPMSRTHTGSRTWSCTGPICVDSCLTKQKHKMFVFVSEQDNTRAHGNCQWRYTASIRRADYCRSNYRR